MGKQDKPQERPPVLLVAVANPATIPELMGLAAKLSAHGGYQCVATHIVTVREQIQLSAARSSPEVSEGTRLLEEAISYAAKIGIHARGVVEVAREVHEGLISAAKNQHAELVVVGYSVVGEQQTAGRGRDERVFDRVMYRVARGAGIDLIVTKFRRPTVGSIMVPVLGGLNLSLTGMILRSLLAADDAAVRFVRAVEPHADAEKQQQDLERVLAEYDLLALGDAEIISASDPEAALVKRADEHDLAIIGAERPTIADTIFGNMAERVASEASCSVLLVRAMRKR